MKSILVTFILAVLVSPSFAWNQRAPLPLAQCKVHAPYGFPNTINVLNAEQTQLLIDKYIHELY